MSAAAERAFSVIKPSADGRWVARIYGVLGKRRRLAIVATGSLDYTRRVSALYCKMTHEVHVRTPSKFTKARAVATSQAANDHEGAPK